MQKVKTKNFAGTDPIITFFLWAARNYVEVWMKVNDQCNDDSK